MFVFTILFPNNVSVVQTAGFCISTAEFHGYISARENFVYISGRLY